MSNNLPESTTHKTLVGAIVKWVHKYYNEEMILYVDSENAMFTDELPPSINTCKPDVFAQGRKSKNIVIGEAKTTQIDLESDHSEIQFTAYLEYCKKNSDCKLVVATPLNIINCAKSIIDVLKKKLHCEQVHTEMINPLYY
ncbi:MAG: hypothetical protein M0P61_13605 [Ignavibacteriaceae bacterium]|nr:hypothetical protein [Ignavibacteriaceae bacterium]